jgi:hypothetical protein
VSRDEPKVIVSRAKAWYERLLGAEPSFIPHATEAVWELAEHHCLFINEDVEGPAERPTPSNEIGLGGGVD